jgi:hypothetical protein
VAKAAESVVPYLSSSDNTTTENTRRDKDLLASIGSLAHTIMTGGNVTEEDNTEARLKHSVIRTEVPSPASSSIAAFFEEYVGSTPPSNNNITSNNTMADDNPFSTSMLFETASILPKLTTYSNDNLIDIDLSRILGLGNERISVELGGQLPSGLELPMGRLEEESLNPVGFFLAFTIRF